MDNAKPTHTTVTVESLTSSWLQVAAQAAVRALRLSIRVAAGLGRGRHRPQPERAGAPRPIPDARPTSESEIAACTVTVAGYQAP